MAIMRDQELAGLAMTLGKDAGIRVTVSGDGSYCSTDGKHINIARMPATPVGVMLMTGLVFHEVGHKNYTVGGKPAGLLGDMTNIVEDVRIEGKSIEDRPGTRFNFDAVTTYYAKKGLLEPQNLNHALLGKAMAYGRGRVLQQAAILPLEDTCNEMMDDAFGSDFIADVEKILKGIPKLKTTKDSQKMAEELIDLLIQQKNPPQPQQPPQQPQQQQGQGQNQDQNQGQGASQDQADGEEDDQGQQGAGQGGGSGQGTEEDENGQAGGKGQQDDQEDGDQEGQDASGSKSDNQQQDDQGQDADGNADQCAGSGGNGAGKGGGNRPTPEEIEKMLQQSTGYGDLTEMILEDLNAIAKNTPNRIKAGIPELPIIGKMISRYGKLDEVEAISTSSRMRARMMGLLEAKKRCPKAFGTSGRKLATGRLVRMSTGDPKIFKKKTESVAINTAALILLDESGSMDTRYHIANPACFALHNTLYGLKGVAVCSMEFSGKSSGQPEVNVLVDFGKKPLSESFNHHPFDGTPTDQAIWAARAMLLQRPEPRKIMLILTDGCPCDGPATQAATARVIKDGIEVAAIGIQHDAVKHYWKNNRVINNLQELPAAMFGVMEDLLMGGNHV